MDVYLPVQRSFKAARLVESHWIVHWLMLCAFKEMASLAPSETRRFLNYGRKAKEYLVDRSEVALLSSLLKKMKKERVHLRGCHHESPARCNSKEAMR